MGRRVSILMLFALAGCGGAGHAFGPTFPDNEADDVEQVLARLRAAPRQPDRPAAVGVSDGRIFAWDLAAGRMLWQEAAEPRSAPHLGGDLVVTQEERGIVARDLATGATRFRTEDEALHLIGAAGEGSLCAIVLSTGGGVGAHSRLIVAREGRIDWDAEVDHALGAPAVRAGMVFVPWSNQNLSVIDAASGHELARLRVADDVLARAFVAEGDVYVGQSGVFRVTPSLASGTRERAAHFTPAVGELPGRPAFLPDAYQPPPGPSSAVHRIRLEWHPAGTGDDLSLANDNLYLVFYKLVFALDPRGEGVRWVIERPADTVGAAAVPGGLWLADAAGTLTFLDAETGRTHPAGSLGARPAVVRLRPAGASPPAAGAPAAPSPLADQLLGVAQSADARLVPARVLAIRYLAALEEPAITTHLIALCERPEAPEAVRSGACTALSERTGGVEQVIEALSRHAAFLEGTTNPPVGPLAQAAIGMRDRRAVPLLLAHLAHPATAVAHLPALLSAIAALGDRDAAGSVRSFVRMYHAEEPTDENAAALVAGLEALVALEGPVARETLEEIGADPLSIPAVRAKARALVTALETPAVTPADQPPEPGLEEDPVEEAPAQELPERINADIVRRVLAPVERELSLCLAQAEGRPRSARLILRLAGNGDLEQVSVTPTAVAACVEPLVRGQRFPANRRRTPQQVVHTLRR